MKRDNSFFKLSAEQMTAMLDNAPVAIYVSAVETKELLYLNRVAEDLFLKKDTKKKKHCYEIAGFDKPCDFCSVEKMNHTSLWEREYENPNDRHIYRLSGKLIDWEGQNAHVEYIVDITKEKKEADESIALRERLQATFSNIPCGLCVYRVDGKFTPIFRNPAFEELMGYTWEESSKNEQKSRIEDVHPDDLELLKEKMHSAIEQNSVVNHSYRVWNREKQEYRYIHLEGSIKTEKEGVKLLYGVYNDITQRLRLEEKLVDANEKMRDIISAIPGGVAIYKVTDIFETKYFSDGIPELSGYTAEEYCELIKQDAAELTYWEDTERVVSKAREVIETHNIARFEFRKQHRKGHLVWVNVQIKWIGEEDGAPLLHCVFLDISDLKEAQLELGHLVNSIPGGIASYRIENNKFIPTFFSDGVPTLSGHTREDFEKIVGEDALNIIYEPDRLRVMDAIGTALETGDILDISYRMRHNDGHLIWIHLNGRRMGPLTESTRFYAVFTGMSSETRMFQNIAGEIADGVYVIDKENYDLLYMNEARNLFTDGKSCIGKKCYAALHGKTAPCDFCTLKSHEPNGEEHEMIISGTEKFYTTRFRETDWNGIPAYVKYVQDVTEEVKSRKEKERLEQYFQTVIKNLPGGVAVVRYGKDGHIKPEFLSDGFALMTGMSLEEAWDLYREDAMAGVHPDDKKDVKKQMKAASSQEKTNWELIYRLKKGDGSYIWIKNNISLIENQGGESRLYAIYHDMTREREEKEQMRQKYNDLILKHYHTPMPNILIAGHCNITKGTILEIKDYTDSDMLKTFGTKREAFFKGISGFIVEEKERQMFLETFLDRPALEAFSREEFEKQLVCFIRLPKHKKSCYAEIKMSMVSAPESGDVTGILTITDITEEVINNRILHQLSVTGYDFVVDLDLTEDRYTVLAHNENACNIPPKEGVHSQWTKYMSSKKLVPKDRERYEKSLDPDYIMERLQNEDRYSFAFSIAEENGVIRTLNLTISAIDLRIGRVCLLRTDITDSIREQQGLLRVIAYTFELAAFVELRSRRFTLYTRETVLNNLSPHLMENYYDVITKHIDEHVVEEEKEELREQLQIETILKRLEEKDTGYDILIPYKAEKGERYKQMNVLWGDANHTTICLV